MNPISTGKQSQFGWYSPASGNILKNSGNSEPSILSESILRSLPSSSSSILNSPIAPLPSISNTQSLIEFTEDTQPLFDTLDTRHSPKEPSRIRKDVSSFTSDSSSDLHIGHKHPHPISTPPSSRSLDLPSSTPLPYGSELPLKRQKMVDLSLSSSSTSSEPELPPQLSDALDLSNDFRDYNTVSGTNLVDFWFSKKIPSDIIALEEAERKTRALNGPNPILTGKFSSIQKQFMDHLNFVPTSTILTDKALDVATSLSNMKNSLKSTIIEKGQGLIDSANRAFNMHPLTSTLDQIAREAKDDTLRGVPLVSEEISFVWPRVSAEFSEMEELARMERISKGLDSQLASKWRYINAEIRDQYEANMSVLTYAKDAIQYTGDMLGHLTLSAKSLLHLAPKDVSQLKEEES